MATAADARQGAEATLLLEKLPLDRAEKLLNEIGASLSGKQKKGPQSNQYTELSSTNFHKSTQALGDLFRAQCVVESPGSTELVLPSTLSTPYKEKIRQMILRYEDEIRSHFQRGENIPKKVLEDFDWQAVVVAASSRLASQETPLLRVSFSFVPITTVSETQSETSVEFTLAELDTTIDELRNCLI